MAKDKSSKTILIIVAVILGIFIIAGIVVGLSCYYLYKTGTAETSSSPSFQSNPILDSESWVTYENDRFGFSLNYPKTFSKTESQNGDGATLTTDSPSLTIRAYGAINLQGQTLDQYLNEVRANLFKEMEGAEEVEVNATTLGDLPAEHRRWDYISPFDGTTTTLDRVTALTNGNFYTLELVIAQSDYAEYYPMYLEILRNFQLGKEQND